MTCRKSVSSWVPSALVSFAAFGLGAFQPAVAQTVEVTASGTIYTVAPLPGAFDSSVSVGTPFAVNFFYQLGAPNLNSDPTTGGYYYPSSSYGMEGTFGDYTISRNGGISQVAVFNRSGGGSDYEVALNSFGSTLTSTNPNAIPLPGQTQFQLGFRDGTGTAANSIALPSASLFQLSNFSGFGSSTTFAIYYQPGPSQLGEAIGTVTSLSAQTLSPVPEASSTVSFVLLLALGLCSAIVAAWRKKAAF